MRAQSPQARRRTRNIIAICLIIVAALAVKPIQILYHDSAMRRAWTRTLQTGATNGQNIATFEQHREALVSLGYLIKQMFPLDHIQPRSTEHRALYDALNQHATRSTGYFSMQGFETSSPLIVIVWATPAHLPEWEAIIKSIPAAKKERR